MNKRALGWVLIAIAVVLASGPEMRAPASERASTFALIVTSNRSTRVSRPDLRYADDDGAKYYDMFRLIASEGDVALLTTFDADTQRLFPHLLGIARSPTEAQVTAVVKDFTDRIRAA